MEENLDAQVLQQRVFTQSVDFPVIPVIQVLGHEREDASKMELGVDESLFVQVREKLSGK